MFNLRHASLLPRNIALKFRINGMFTSIGLHRRRIHLATMDLLRLTRMNFAAVFRVATFNNNLLSINGRLRLIFT